MLRNKEIKLVKVLWHNHDIEEETWEREDEICHKYPELHVGSIRAAPIGM